MATQWSLNTESGILRKNKPKEKHEELLVFGYACKLFRDDERALYIDQGKHLIPWMGDENIRVDRYDCRGHLSDLKPYERSREGYDATRWLGLSESERKLEQLCDDERYYSLQINEEEEELYKAIDKLLSKDRGRALMPRSVFPHRPIIALPLKTIIEEEQKRQKANEFQYNYDVPTNPDAPQEGIPTVPEADEEEEEYVPPIELDVPVDIPIPKTVKENTRIEKTALFVSKQGLQMEILLKTKQGDNPQFSFLNQGDPLFKFYRHVLQAIKNGRYQVQSLKNAETKTESNEQSGGEDHYLHPSLVATTLHSEIQTSSITIPSVPYKPSANCAYSQLVNRIQGTANVSGDGLSQTPQGPPDVVPQPVPIQPEQVPQNFNQMTYEQQQQYYQYYYTAQYYEYYKQMAQYQQNQQQGDGQIPPPDIQLDQNMQTYIQQMVYAQYMQHQEQQQQQQQQQQQNNPYAQIVTNVNKDVSNPYSALLANLPQPQQLQENLEINKGSIAYISNPAQEPARINEEPEQVPVQKDSTISLQSKKPLLSLAQYGSGTDSEEDSSDSDSEATKQSFAIPSGDTQVVIDKMAVYVSKNGIQFEEIVKAKGDPRFNFLYDTHEFYKYYRNKIAQLKGETTKAVTEEVSDADVQKSKADAKNKATTPTKSKEKKVIAPVCFSIKKAKEDVTKEIKSALPMEESDEESDSKSVQTENTHLPQEASATSIATPVIYSSPVAIPTLLKPAISTVQSLKYITAAEASTDVNENKSISLNADSDSSKEPLSSLLTTAMKKNGVLDTDDPILEMIDLTDDLEERKGAKRAADKIKDKLAAAAREKLALAARDKALQLERKKKLAAFFKLKSVEPNQSETTLPTSNKTSNSSTNNSSRRSSVDSVEVNSVKTPNKQETVLLEKDVKQEKVLEKHNSRDKSSTKSHRKKRDRSSKERDKKKEKQDRGTSSESEISLKKYDIINLDDSDSEDGELKKKKKSSKKKKSHKRKHSKSKHESRSKKRSKKKRKRSGSSSSISS